MNEQTAKSYQQSNLTAAASQAARAPNDYQIHAQPGIIGGAPSQTFEPISNIANQISREIAESI